MPAVSLVENRVEKSWKRTLMNHAMIGHSERFHPDQSEFSVSLLE